MGPFPGGLVFSVFIVPGFPPVPVPEVEEFAFDDLVYVLDPDPELVALPLGPDPHDFSADVGRQPPVGNVDLEVDLGSGGEVQVDVHDHPEALPGNLVQGGHLPPRVQPLSLDPDELDRDQAFEAEELPLIL